MTRMPPRPIPPSPFYFVAVAIWSLAIGVIAAAWALDLL